MSDLKVSTIIGANTVSGDKEFELGTKARTTDGKLAMYVKAAELILKGLWVNVDEDFNATINASQIGSAGKAAYDILDGQYGFIVLTENFGTSSI
jgi:hypothetical protein